MQNVLRERPDLVYNLCGKPPDVDIVELYRQTSMSVSLNGECVLTKTDDNDNNLIAMEDCRFNSKRSVNVVLHCE
jgi:hypothetical protein